MAALWDARARSSCPAFAFDQLASKDSEEFDNLDDPFGGNVDWFKDHIELVGQPRPERLPERTPDKDLSPSGSDRKEALRQLTSMAERYRAKLEERKRDVRLHHKARSSPDLTAEYSDALVAKDKRLGELAAAASQWRCCTAWCATASLLEDACWRLLLRASRLLRLRRDAPGPCGGDSAFHSPENSLIIFDWDDTLLPTSYILQKVLPSMPFHNREGAVPRDSLYYEELASHAHLVGFVLRAARRVSRVAIVTNSMSPWVAAGGARFMPGLDVEGLLEELGIPVYYARRHTDEIAAQLEYHEEYLNITLDHTENDRIGLDIIPSTDSSLRIARIDDVGLVSKWNDAHPATQVLPGDWIVEVNGVTKNLAQECRKPQMLTIKLKRQTADKDPFVESKKRDMLDCMNRFFDGQGRRANVISIGDSQAEQIALKEALPRTGNPHLDPLCKTVALLLRPTVQQLSNELKILAVWLCRMVQYDKDFDLAMDNLNSLERELFRA